MTKLTFGAIATATALFAAPAAWAQVVAPAVCPTGFLDGGLVIDAAGNQQRICTPDPAAAPPAPVTVDTHGRRDITIAQLEGIMETFGAVRIARADLAQGSPERAAVLGAFEGLWEFTPGAATPGLLLGVDTVGAPVFVTGSDGSRIGMRIERVSGDYVVYLFPGDDDCVVNDRPASPSMWARICVAEGS